MRQKAPWKTEMLYKHSVLTKYWCLYEFKIVQQRTKRVSKPIGLRIASSGDCQNSQFWCTSNVGTRLGGSLSQNPNHVLGTFKTCNLGAPTILVPVWVFPKMPLKPQERPLKLQNGLSGPFRLGAWGMLIHLPAIFWPLIFLQKVPVFPLSLCKPGSVNTVFLFVGLLDISSYGFSPLNSANALMCDTLAPSQLPPRILRSLYGLSQFVAKAQNRPQDFGPRMGGLRVIS